MSPAPPPLSLRLGDEGARALDELARRRRVTRAEAARQATIETAARERRRAGLAAAAAALMADPDDVAEAPEDGVARPSRRRARELGRGLARVARPAVPRNRRIPMCPRAC